MMRVALRVWPETSVHRHQDICPLQAELSHSRAAVTNSSEGRQRSSLIDHASDRFTVNTGYSQMDGTQPWVKTRCL